MIDFDYRKCPLCKGFNTVRRSGVHFDHELRCLDCKRSYDPQVEYDKAVRAEEERLKQVTDKD